MFEIVAELLPVVLGLYLLDALYHVPAGSCLLVTRWRAGARRVGSGWRVAGLLPTQRVFRAGRPSVLVGGGALFLRSEGGEEESASFRREDFRRLAWEEAHRLQVEDRRLRLGAEAVAALPSAPQARALARRLAEWAALSGSEREARVAAADRDAFDLPALERRREEAEGRLAWAEGLSLSLWAIVVLGLPASRLYGSALGLNLAVGAAGALYLAALAAAALAGRALERLGAPRAARIVPLVLCPPAALRAPASLSEDLFSSFDHLTAAAALLPRRAFLDLARGELHALRGDAWGASDGAAEEEGAWRDACDGRRRALGGLLERMGLREEEALAPPPKLDPTAALYCPACGGEFKAGTPRCPDCELPLVAFDPPAPERAAVR